MKQHNLVDLVKFLLSILVVAIHMGVPILAELGRIAVPYFFIISGYFFFGKYNSSPDLKSRQRLFYKYSKRIMQLFSSWLVIYLPLVFLGIYNSKDPLAVSIFGLVSGRLPNFRTSLVLNRLYNWAGHIFDIKALSSMDNSFIYFCYNRNIHNLKHFILWTAPQCRHLHSWIKICTIFIS